VENIHLQKAYVYLFGLYLGDGYIVKNKRIFFLRISLDARYPNIINSCYNAIQTILPHNKVYIFNSKQGNWVEVIGYYKFWPDLFPQHGAGTKHEREIKLEDWQQRIIETYPLEFFRVLYHSDGSRFSNIVNGKDYPRYQFSNSSKDIRELFCRTCDLLSLRWTDNPGKKLVCKEVFISKRKDVEFLDRLVGPKN
jgi:hypothetical protein